MIESLPGDASALARRVHRIIDDIPVNLRGFSWPVDPVELEKAKRAWLEAVLKGKKRSSDGIRRVAVFVGAQQ